MHVARPFIAHASLLLAAALACNGLAGGSTAAGADTSCADAPTDAHGPPATPPTTPVADATSTGAASTSSSSAPQTATPADASTTADATASTGTTTDAGTSTTDASTGTTDASTGTIDASTGTTDASTTDASTTGTSTGGPDGLGELSGDCGLIDAMELDSPMAFVFTGAIDFGAVGFDYDLLTDGGKQIYDEGNLNPNSLDSEVVAYEVLARCEGAALLKTEATIVYKNPMGKKTDLLVDIDGLKVGVSVVRAVGFPQDDPWTPAQAQMILQKKLDDIIVSSANVAPEDAWVKQILSVVAYGPMHLESLLTAYAGLSAQTKADTILVITVTNGDDAFIY